MKRGLRELAEWFLIPALAALLPWPLCFRLLRRLSRARRLLARECADAARGYQQCYGQPPDEAWLQHHRLVLLVDRADVFLSATRSDRWLALHLERRGEWPAGPFFAISFHHGNGLWAMRDMRRCGQRVSFISLRFTINNFDGRRIPYTFARYRFRQVSRAGNAPVIYTGGSTPLIRSTLAGGACVLGLIDVPHGRHRGRIKTRLLAREACLPGEMLRLAEQSRVPVAGYTIYLDWESGRRRLEVVAVPTGPVETQVHFLAALLDHAIKAQPEAWQLWSVAPAFSQDETQSRSEVKRLTS